MFRTKRAPASVLYVDMPLIVLLIIISLLHLRELKIGGNCANFTQKNGCEENSMFCVLFVVCVGRVRAEGQGGAAEWLGVDAGGGNGEPGE